jgi:hypothetical protein
MSKRSGHSIAMEASIGTVIAAVAVMAYSGGVQSRLLEPLPEFLAETVYRPVCPNEESSTRGVCDARNCLVVTMPRTAFCD